MNIVENFVVKLLPYIPTNWRIELKSLYEGMPHFGRKMFYAERGEDAFLQSYFHERVVFSSRSEKKLPLYLRKAVGPGFFVDVGANAPIFNSNTYYFYRLGWRGINIDAAPGSMNAFQKKRRRDINIEALVGDKEEELIFYHWATPFPANTASAEYARIMAQQYGKEPSEIKMNVLKLETILDAHLPPEQAITFMTIDVEGLDLQVLRSNDWERYRPELVLVEDYKFDIAESTMSEIYQFMIGVGYEMLAWIRPTIVFRRVGLEDWKDLIVHELSIMST